MFCLRCTVHVLVAVQFGLWTMKAELCFSVDDIVHYFQVISATAARNSKLIFFLLSLVSKTAAETAREYDSCAHRRCWTAAASCRYYSCRRRAKAVGLVLPSVYCSRTRCCAIRFVDDESRALVSFVSLYIRIYIYISWESADARYKKTCFLHQFTNICGT